MNNKILLVEDSKSLRSLISQELQSLDCEVVATGSVAETNDVLQQDTDFFCAVLDYCLPDGPSGEVIDLVLDKNIKIVVMTSYFNPEIRDHFLSKGVLEYILKDSITSVSYLNPFIKRLMSNVNHRALVVDDSRSIRATIVQLLNDEYIESIEAEDGQDALEKLSENHNISFVITDYDMPNKNGVDMIKEMRNTYDQAQLAILGLSASEDRTLTAQFLKAGANDFLHKPFNQEEFYCRIHHMLNMKEATDELYKLANQDSLTGLWNRRYLFRHQTGQQDDRCVAMIDIDFFKKVNDTYGHDGGDAVLVKISKIIKDSLPNEVCVRFGGEEFCIVHQGGFDAFKTLLEKMRCEIEQCHIPNNGDIIRCTISIGVSQTQGSLEQQIKTADHWLYEAKHHGRNQLCHD